MDTLVLKNNFYELNDDEMNLISAGGFWAALGVGLLTVGTVALSVVAAPAGVAALTAVGIAAGTAKVVVGAGIALEVIGGVGSTVAAY